MSVNGREALPDIQEWSGDPQVMSGNGRESHPYVREWSEGLP